VPGSVTIVLTSPRVAPGLLTWPTWQLLRESDAVGCADPDSPGPGAVVRAGELRLQRVEGDPWGWLTGVAEGGGSAVWYASDDGDPGLLRRAADAVAAEPRPAYTVEILHGSYDVPGARLIDLVRVMDRLRRECPWDREQTHRSLATYLLEEAYETLEAIDTGDREHLREELGDLLLQVMFHSRIAEEHPEDPWSVDDVAGDIVDKLVRRHPHVFADTHAPDSATVESNWDSIKATEKQRTSVLEGVPQALPALALADKVLSRAAKLDKRSGPSDQASRGPSGPSDQLGADLLDLVRRARAEGIDPEQALRDAVRGLIADIAAAEATP
jgi:XTP/dITP diphosphohydrolase